MTILRRLALVCGIGVVVMAATLGVRAAWPLEPELPKPPTIECPSLVDLGSHAEGEIVTGRFRVANLGAEPLQLTRFRTSCSCAGVETDETGENRRVQAASIPPGGDREFLVRMVIGVRPGTPQGVLVQFETNDPNRPSMAIQVMVPRVTGGIYIEPRAVLFGELGRGEQPIITINLYDNHETGLQVDEIVSRNPDRFTVRYRRVSAEDAPEEHPIAGRLLGRCEVTPISGQAGSLEGVIEVRPTSGTRPLAIIPVTGRVVTTVTVFPSVLVLPRMVGGQSEWSGEVILVGRDGRPFQPTLQAIPDGLQVTLDPIMGSTDRVRLRVACSPVDRVDRPPVVESRITIRVTPSSGPAEDVSVVVAHPRGEPK